MNIEITPEHKLYLEFSINCAYRVLNKFEEKYPKDERPRKALIAAWNFLINPTEDNQADAANAANAAAYAVNAANAANAAAYAVNAAYEKKWQVGLLFALNAKYKLSVKIRGVE